MRLVTQALIVGALLYSAPAEAQTTAPDTTACKTMVSISSGFSFSDARRSLERAISITRLPEQSSLFRASSLPAKSCAQDVAFLNKWFRHGVADLHVQALPVEVGAFTNSKYPRTVNDGAGWHGVGLNLGARAGMRESWKFLNAQVLPEIYFQENRDFKYVAGPALPGSQYANPFHSTIDYPTRFGAKSFSTIVPGQSFIQANAGPAAITFSTENTWIGAAEIYPILMSYTAPGFTHIRIGTQRRVDIRVAYLEAQVLLGGLNESDYFDGDPRNDNHYFTTTMLVLEPKFIRGLFLGVARAYHDSADAGGQSLGFYARRLVDSPFGGNNSRNGAGNGIGIVLARWVLPASAFEVYAEWSREDTPGGVLDLLREPDWTQAYVLGFQKSFLKPDHLVRFYGELNHLGESAPSRAGRGFFSYYTHHLVTQGHTNRGQLLGAAIGPGSDAQLLGLDVFTGSGRSAFRVERTRYDDDMYYRAFARRFGETRHDAEITLSASRMQFVKGLEVELGADVSRRYGRGFIPLFGPDNADLIETNFAAHVVATWIPPW